MISKEELAQVLREEKYSEEQIDRALKGQISSVLNKGKIDRIHSRLQVLEQLKINKDKIIDGIAILISGSNENIRDNYQTLRVDLGVSQEGIENRLIILARGKKDKMQAIMAVLLSHNVTMEQINSCLTLLMENEADGVLQHYSRRKNPFSFWGKRDIIKQRQIKGCGENNGFFKR